MKKYLGKNYLENIFQALKKELRTGLDKVTLSKFKKVREREFSIIKRKCLDSTYKFTRLKEYTKDGRKHYVPTIRDRVLIELLRGVLERKLSIIYPDRESIIKLLKQKVFSEQNSFIVRLDIKDFFDSIPHNFLLEQLKTNYRISSIEYHLVKEYLELMGKKGVPTGISLSNTLSEIYLKNLDFELKNIDPKISCYFRYVDDILIMVNGNLKKREAKQLKSKILTAVKENGLEINKSKYESCNLKFSQNGFSKFSYLGYLFLVNNRSATISIDDKKTEKIKSKIKFIFHDYRRSKNLELFFRRLKFLTRKNTMVRTQLDLTPQLGIVESYNLVFYGIIETYKHVDKAKWYKLDKYLQGNFYTFFKNKINKNSRFKNKLFRHSFVNSIENDLTNFFHSRDNNFFIERLHDINPNRNRNKLNQLNRNELEQEYKKVLSL